jgi:hypothetical protein
MSTQTGQFSDSDALAKLQLAAEVVGDVLAMVQEALRRGLNEDSHAIHIAELKAQRLRAEELGTKVGERAILRAHPLYTLWKLALRASDQLQRLYSVLNPKLFAERAVELDAAREVARAARIGAQAHAIA